MHFWPRMCACSAASALLLLLLPAIQPNRNRNVQLKLEHTHTHKLTLLASIIQTIYYAITHMRFSAQTNFAARSARRIALAAFSSLPSFDIKKLNTWCVQWRPTWIILSGEARSENGRARESDRDTKRHKNKRLPNTIRAKKVKLH